MPQLTKKAKAIIDDFVAKIQAEWGPARSIPRPWKNYLLKQLRVETRPREISPKAVCVCLEILRKTVNNDARLPVSKTSPHRPAEVCPEDRLTEDEKHAIATSCGVTVRTVERWNNALNTYFADADKELPLSRKDVVLAAVGRFMYERPPPSSDSF